MKALSPAALATYADRRYADGGNLALVQLIAPEHRKVLDVGCGSGDTGRLLAARGCEVHGITASAAEYPAAAAVLARVTLADVERTDPGYAPGSFDAMVLSHLLEHLVAPAAALKRLARWVRPGGGVYIAVPNIAYWRERWHHVSGRFEYTDHGIRDQTHLRFFTVDSAKSLVASAGLRVVSVTVEGHAPLRPLRAIAPGAAAWIDRAACRVFPNLFGYQILIVAEPASDPSEGAACA